MQINRQLLTQIKALRKAQQRVIELTTRETQVNTSSKVHLSAPADLRFKLNQRRSRTTSPPDDPECHRTNPSREWTRGHHAPTRKRKKNTSPTAT